jgi:hypothetical protein
LSQAMTYDFEVCLPLVKQGRDQSVGARREWHDIHICVCIMVGCSFVNCEFLALLLPLFALAVLMPLLLLVAKHTTRPQHEEARAETPCRDGRGMGEGQRGLCEDDPKLYV